MTDQREPERDIRYGMLQEIIKLWPLLSDIDRAHLY